MSKRIISHLHELTFLSSSQQRRLVKIYSPRSGIINLLAYRTELENYGLKMYQCLSAQARVLFDLEREVSSGGLGISSSERHAFLACIGEAMERYSMSCVNKSLLTAARRQDLAARHAPPFLHFYSPAQRNRFGYPDPNNDLVVWTKIFSLANEEQYIYWPASLVYLPFPNAQQVAESSSTGVAAHPSRHEAIRSGILEVLERDALMLNHFRRLNPPSLDLATVYDSNRPLLRQIQRRYNIRIFRLYSDIDVPIYLGYIWRNYGKTLHYGIGAAANLDSSSALNKVLRECLFTYFYSRKLLNLRPRTVQDIATLYEHFLYYQDRKFLSLVKGHAVITYKPIKISWSQLLASLNSCRLTPYFYDLTTPDVATAGLHVVKAVIPGCVDLNKTHGLCRIAAPRLNKVPRKLKLSAEPGINPAPHPFP